MAAREVMNYQNAQHPQRIGEAATPDDRHGENIASRRFVSQPSWWAALCTISVMVVLAGLNLSMHHTALVRSPEMDGYFAQADGMLQGKPYTDPYRPPLYALLTAGVSYLFAVPPFTAATLISALATGLLVGLTYLMARLFVAPPYALLAQGLVALDRLVLEHGMFAATDALFALLCVATLLAVVLSQVNSRWAGTGGTLLIGVMAGLAYLTRYTALFLAPLIVYGLCANNVPWRLRLRNLGLAAAGAGVIALPWLTYNAVMNGSPFANQNWRNFAFALYGNGDFNYLQRVPFNGYLDIILHDPVAVLKLWAKNSVDVAINLSLHHSSSLLLAVLLPFGIFACLRIGKVGLFPLLYVLLCAAPTVLTFLYTPRLLLPATPVVILVAVIGLEQIFSAKADPTMVRSQVQAGWLARLLAPKRALQCMVILLCGLLAVQKLPAAYTSMVNNQPTAEIGMLKTLLDTAETAQQKPLRIIATYRYACYFARCPHYVEQSWVASYDTQFPALLSNAAAAHAVDYILAGDLSAEKAISAGIVDRALSDCWVVIDERANHSGLARLYQNSCSRESRRP